MPCNFVAECICYSKRSYRSRQKFHLYIRIFISFAIVRIDGYRYRLRKKNSYSNFMFLLSIRMI